MAFPSCSSLAEYLSLYKQSIEDPRVFWGQLAKDNLLWIRPFITSYQGQFCSGDGHTRWFSGGSLNASQNCLDRHLPEGASNIALHWINERFEHQAWSYAKLHQEVCKFSNFLHNDLGVKKGETVTIYMSMTPEAVVAMLSCARIGAVHNVVFGGFSALSLRERITNCRSRVVICSDVSLRASKQLRLVDSVVEAIKDLTIVDAVVIHRRFTDSLPNVGSTRAFDYEDSIRAQISSFDPVPMDSEDPLFLLYTSGSTGKPKAVVHTTAGYLLYVKTTINYVFDMRAKDIMGTFADIGWITGHSYVVYGPLLHGISTVLFEGSPLYPDCNTLAKCIEQLSITQLYTAPTVIRLLKQNHFDGSKFVMSSLRVIGSVGEPLNADASLWYSEQFGKGRTLVDTYWQSETGGHMITCLPNVTLYKPGAASFPFFGVRPVLLGESGDVIEGPNQDGTLYFAQPWPGMTRTLWGDHERFAQCYFPSSNGLFYTGDRAYRDADGYIYVRGRMDDVINTSGHRLSSAELESAACNCKFVSECAAVGRPDDIIGEAIWLFCILKASHAFDLSNERELASAVRDNVRRIIGPLASPRGILFVKELPKTRSGKIMRRLLKRILVDNNAELGDISTLNNPDSLVDIRRALIEQSSK